MTNALECLESSSSRYNLHLRFRRQDVWLVLTTADGYGVSNQVLASFRREPHRDELVLECMARLRSGCVQYSSPVSESLDGFPGFSDVIGEHFHDRVFVAVHGWHYTDVHAAFLEASRHAFGAEDGFAGVEFVLVSLWPFVAAVVC